MANMSYCRFQNTLGDLRDCVDALDQINGLDELSTEEAEAARRLIKLCREVAENWESTD